MMYKSELKENYLALLETCTDCTEFNFELGKNLKF